MLCYTISMRLIKQLDIKDEVIEVLEGKRSYNTVLPHPQKVIDSKLESQGYVEDSYVKENQLQLVHRLLLRRATTNQIADTLKVSGGEANDLVKELKLRLADQLRKKDPMELVAEGEAFYDEIIAEAMKQLDKVKASNKVHDIVRVLEIALRARSEKDKFLVNTGILNNNQQSESVREDEYAVQASEVKGLLSDIMLGAVEEVTLLD